jgi:hypothetical protein
MMTPMPQPAVAKAGQGEARGWRAPTCPTPVVAPHGSVKDEPQPMIAAQRGWSLGALCRDGKRHEAGQRAVGLQAPR